MVYGNFIEPTMGKNFVMMRIPAGRQPWTKKIAPAINRLVRPWFSADDRDRYWNVDGEPTILCEDDGTPKSKRLWETTLTPRYEWNGSEIVKVEASQ
jgi:hypothetical protein